MKDSTTFWKEKSPTRSSIRSLARSFVRPFAFSFGKTALNQHFGSTEKLQSNEKLLALFLSTIRATHMRTKIQCDKLMHDSRCTTGVRRRRETSQGASPFGLGRAERTGICVQGKEIRCYSHVCSLSKYIEM